MKQNSCRRAPLLPFTLVVLQLLFAISGAGLAVINPPSVSEALRKLPVLGQLLATASEPKTALAAGAITGRVYRDFNSNGERSQQLLGYGIDDMGVSGVTVRAYDSAGVLRGSATTAANGTYTLNASGTGPYRIEFSNLPADYQPSYHATDSVNGNTDFFTGSSLAGTSVQFVADGNTSNVNLAINRPCDYCQDNPSAVAPIYSNGTRDALLGDPRGLAEFSYDWAYPTGVTGLRNDIGTVWGLAYHREAKKLFSASFLKRHAGLGLAGLGGIYVSDVSNFNIFTKTATVLVDLDGPNSNNANDGILNVGTLDDSQTLLTPLAGRGLPYVSPIIPSFDSEAFSKVGKVGFGDLDLDEESDKLYVVNLNTKRVNGIDIADYIDNGTPIAASNVFTLTAYPNPGCSGGEDRPWALKVHDDKLYVGVICDGSTTFLGLNINLNARVYSYDLVAGTWSTAVPTFSLTYLRGIITPFWPLPGVWNQWIDNNFLSFLLHPQTLSPINTYPQPILSDIEFDEFDHMTLGFMDRGGNQWGHFNFQPFGPEPVEYTAGGDVLRAFKTGANAWEVEQYGIGGNWPNASNGSGLNACMVLGLLQGPGGAEYYCGDAYPGPGPAAIHWETGVGGLAQLPGSRDILMSSFDPNLLPYSQGVLWMSNDSGLKKRGLELALGAAAFGKAGGIGDVELLCNASPIELGNRVWRDDDKDGIQDPNEPPLAGVQVSLQMGNVVVSKRTDLNGEYYFNRLNNTTLIPANAPYTITVATTQSALKGLELTGANLNSISTNHSITDVIDSDGILSGTLARIQGVTGDAGYNNHSLDFGFKPRPPQVTIRKATETEVENCVEFISSDTIDFVSSDNRACVYSYQVAAANANDTFNFTNDINTRTGSTPTFALGIGAELKLVDVISGTYNLAEVAPTTPWSLVGSSCSNGSSAASLVITSTDVTCIFTNRLQPPTTSYTLTKQLMTPNPVQVGQLISFTIRITNTGGTLISSLPLTDTYNTAYLAYSSPRGSNPATTDNADDGQLNWSDVTGAGSLAPNGALNVVTWFIAEADTTTLPAQAPCTLTSHTCNVVRGPNGVAAFVPVQITIEQKSTLGDWVWYDINQNGVKDDGNTGINGVRINLYVDGLRGNPTDGVPQPGEFITSTITANDVLDIGDDTNNTAGFYDFRVNDNLPFIVEVDPSNFNPGGPLNGMTYTGNNAATPYNGDDPRVVLPMIGPFDYNNVDFPFWRPTGTVAVEKQLNTPEPLRVGDPVSFTIRITNTSGITITTLPLEDRFDRNMLTYVSANPAPITVTPGVLLWSNLAPLGGLAPSASTTIVVSFLARADTMLQTPVAPCTEHGETSNIAEVRNAITGIAPVIPDTDDKACASVAIISPTAVQLRQPSASYNEGKVTLTWATESEAEANGFNILRLDLSEGSAYAAANEETGGQWLKLNQELIQAQQPGQAAGASYSFTDSSVQVGHNYRYVLEILDNSSQTAWREIAIVTTGSRVFLMLIKR